MSDKPPYVCVKNDMGNWECRTTREVPGFPDVQLTVLTARRFHGALTTSLSGSRKDKHGMLSHTVYEDYSDSRYIHRRVPRCTKEVVIEQHEEALKELDTILKVASTHYTCLFKQPHTSG